MSKSFNGFSALHDVNLSVPDGSLTALLGPSGGGKSTLPRVIAGLERPDTGEVLFSGESVTGLPAQQRGVGFVFQHYAAFKHMTVRDNIAFGLTIRKRPKDEVRAHSTSCWRSSIWRALPSAIPRSCRAASASAWRWRARTAPSSSRHD